MLGPAASQNPALLNTFYSTSILTTEFKTTISIPFVAGFQAKAAFGAQELFLHLTFT